MRKKCRRYLVHEAQRLCVRAMAWWKQASARGHAQADDLCGNISQRHEPSKTLVMPLLCRPSNAGIGKAFPANFFGTVYIAQVDQDWRLKKIADATEVEGAESLPFRN